jgi:hypothetical protein
MRHYARFSVRNLLLDPEHVRIRDPARVLARIDVDSDGIYPGFAFFVESQDLLNLFGHLSAEELDQLWYAALEHNRGH